MAAAHDALMAAGRDPEELAATRDRFEALLAELRADSDVDVIAFLNRSLIKGGRRD